MVIADLTSFIDFSWDDLLALDLSQPASWLMLAALVMSCIATIYLALSLYPYFEMIDDKLIELLGGKE